MLSLKICTTLRLEFGVEVVERSFFPQTDWLRCLSRRAGMLHLALFNRAIEHGEQHVEFNQISKELSFASSIILQVIWMLYLSWLGGSPQLWKKMSRAMRSWELFAWSFLCNEASDTSWIFSFSNQPTIPHGHVRHFSQEIMIKTYKNIEHFVIQCKYTTKLWRKRIQKAPAKWAIWALRLRRVNVLRASPAKRMSGHRSFPARWVKVSGFFLLPPLLSSPPDFNCELQISVGCHWDLALAVEVRQCPCQRECRIECQMVSIYRYILYTYIYIYAINTSRWYVRSYVCQNSV